MEFPTAACLRLRICPLVSCRAPPSVIQPSGSTGRMLRRSDPIHSCREGRRTLDLNTTRLLPLPAGLDAGSLASPDTRHLACLGGPNCLVWTSLGGPRALSGGSARRTVCTAMQCHGSGMGGWTSLCTWTTTSARAAPHRPRPSVLPTAADGFFCGRGSEGQCWPEEPGRVSRGRSLAHVHGLRAASGTVRSPQREASEKLRLRDVEIAVGRKCAGAGCRECDTSAGRQAACMRIWESHSGSRVQAGYREARSEVAFCGTLFSLASARFPWAGTARARRLFVCLLFDRRQGRVCVKWRSSGLRAEGEWLRLLRRGGIGGRSA